MIARIATMMILVTGISSYADAKMKFRNVVVPSQSKTVYMLHRDDMGMMWFGTGDGLYNFDGYTAHPVFEHGSQANTHVHALAETDSAFYLASDNGILVFDRHHNVFQDVPEGSPRDIRTIIREGNGFLIGGLQGLYRYIPSSGSFEAITDGLPHKAVYALASDGDTYFIGTYDGMGCIKHGAHKVKPFDPGFGDTSSFRNLFVNSLYLDHRRHKLWIGTEGDLYSYDADNGRLSREIRLSGSIIKSIAVTTDGIIFAGTDSGLIELDGDQMAVYRHDSRDKSSIANNIVWSLLVDCDSNLWVATDYGLSMTSRGLPYERIALEDMTGRGDGNVVQTIGTDSASSIIWIGGNNGLIRYDMASGASRWYQPGNIDWPLSHNNVRDICFDSDGVMWIATDGSVSRLDTFTGRFENFKIIDSSGKNNANWAYSIIDDRNGALWIGSYLGGIFVVNKDQFCQNGGNVVAECNLTESSGLPNNYVRKLVRSSDGTVFAICFASPVICGIDSRTLEHTEYRIDQTVDILPTCMMTDNAGHVWVGYSGGIALIDSKKHEVRRTEFPVDYSVDPLAMTSVDDEIWISTTSGIWSYDPQSGDFSLLRLPMVCGNAIFYDAGAHWVAVGATDEIVTVDPAKARAIPSPRHALYLTSVKINGEPLKDVDPMTVEALSVEHGGNYLEFTVSDLDFAPQSHVRYEYRLIGAANPEYRVLDPGTNKIVLSGLKSGRYTLEVRMSGEKDVLLSLPISVKAPWYFSTVAKILYFLLLVLIIAGCVKFRIMRQRQRRERAERESSLARVKNRMDFLTNISHELKSPLSMVIGPVSHLLDQTTDPEMRRHLAGIHRNAVNLDQLLHRALELNRIDKDDDTLVITSRVELVGFLRNICDNFAANHPDKRFVFNTTEDSLTVSVDVVKMESVVNNLLSNACKYSSANATVAVSLSIVAERFFLRVSDDGIGIPAGERHLVFQRLFRSSNSGTADGTGIGLYLTRKYVEMHGGTISVDANGGGGAVFTVEIPLAALSICHTTDTTEDKSSDNSRPSVLIVEDNSDIARFIEELLHKDFRCIVAGNGRAGLAVMATIVPDLVVADLMMPVMGGLEMVGQMKRNVRYASVPVLVLTAKDDPETQRNCFEAGVDAFVAKPFDAPVFLSRIKSLMGSRQRMASSVKAEILSTPKDSLAESSDEKKMKEISRLIDDNLSDSCLSVAFLAEKTSMTTKQLYRLVKKYVGLSPVDLIKTMRLRKAAMFLRQRKFTVSEVMYMTGFNSASYFSKCFTSQYGMSPKNYMNTDDPDSA